MNTLFCSDLHIGHHKVAEIRVPPTTIPDCMQDRITGIHDKLLALAWDRKVRKDDIVYILGDISSGSTSGVKHALEWLKARPGRKRLITGNHDPIWPYHRDCHKWFPAFMDVFESVQAFGRVRIHLGEGYVTAWMSHFPFESDHSETPRFPEARLKDCGQYLLHGHTHDTSVLNPFNRREIHVGVDAWNLAPVSMGEIAEIIKGLENDQ